MARTTGATGAPGTLIKTGQSRSLAKDVACIPPSYDRLPELAAAGVRQDYPFLGELAEASKRLLFWTDISSHQAIIRARVDGNEHVDLEEVTTLALDQQSDIPCVSIKIRASMHISQVSAFGRFVSDDKTGLERSAITPVCTVAQSVSTSAWPAGYDTQYSRRMLVPDSDALMLLEGKENYGVYPDR
ncbi:GL17033 [Drosophila persimilis]|uniref:GL17033 n=1 Tax=Drosophila persimilis TaxID=7234 RepID=B4GH06_DROPE|nr:GL17033 [Drosophila persimilis]